MVCGLPRGRGASPYELAVARLGAWHWGKSVSGPLAVARPGGPFLDVGVLPSERIHVDVEPVTMGK